MFDFDWKESSEKAKRKRRVPSHFLHNNGLDKRPHWFAYLLACQGKGTEVQSFKGTSRANRVTTWKQKRHKSAQIEPHNNTVYACKNVGSWPCSGGGSSRTMMMAVPKQCSVRLGISPPPGQLYCLVWDDVRDNNDDDTHMTPKGRFAFSHAAQTPEVPSLFNNSSRFLRVEPPRIHPLGICWMHSGKKVCGNIRLLWTSNITGPQLIYELFLRALVTLELSTQCTNSPSDNIRHVNRSHTTFLLWWLNEKKKLMTNVCVCFLLARAIHGNWHAIAILGRLKNKVTANNNTSNRFSCTMLLLFQTDVFISQCEQKELKTNPSVCDSCWPQMLCNWSVLKSSAWINSHFFSWTRNVCQTWSKLWLSTGLALPLSWFASLLLE